MQLSDYASQNKIPTVVSCFGNALSIVALLFMGPVFFIRLKPSLSLIQVGIHIETVFKQIMYALGPSPGNVGNKRNWGSFHNN